MYSESFRAGVIALLMYDKSFLSALAPVIKSRYFETKAEQHTVRAILEHFKEHGKVPRKAIVLERVLHYLDTMKSTNVTGEDIADYLESSAALRGEIQENTMYVRDKAIKFCQQMAIRDAIIESVDLLEKGGDLDKIQTLITDATRVGHYGLMDNGLFLLEEAGKEGSKVDEPRKVISTGLPWIDPHCKGGLAKKELGLVVAPPHTGKSTALVNIGVGMVKNGHKVVHFTCEMSKNIVGRMYRNNITKRSDLDIDKLSEDQQKSMHMWMNKLKKRLKADVHIAEFPTNRLSIEGIVAYLTMLESQFNFQPDAIIVDYVDILERPKHIREDHLQLEWLTSELRAIAGEFNKAVWSASQVNRTGTEKQTAMMSDMAGSFAKNMIADIIIGLNQTIKEQEDDMLRTFWMKNRAGRKFMTDTLITDFDRARFEMP